MTYDPDNIFAKILKGDIPCHKVYEDEHALAFEDISPAAPHHVLVIPRGEYTSYHDFIANAPVELMTGFFQAVRNVAEELGIAESGYRLITNTGPNASQSVPHFHVHILGGRPLGGLLPGDAEAR